ncbi:hypothetical protein VVYB158_07865 [Vibrio vulnificus CladeA-yb158]|nr:hypothetical protein VVYB158_07865 [Vibrio vulnificus CladeA-yb158]HAS8326126.1 hypothetical protein [Vibrio vulnificus]
MKTTQTTHIRKAKIQDLQQVAFLCRERAEKMGALPKDTCHYEPTAIQFQERLKDRDSLLLVEGPNEHTALRGLLLGKYVSTSRKDYFYIEILYISSSNIDVKKNLKKEFIALFKHWTTIKRNADKPLVYVELPMPRF